MKRYNLKIWQFDNSTMKKVGFMKDYWDFATGEHEEHKVFTKNST